MKNIQRPVTIVVPVYGDWPSLADCIDSLTTNISAKSGHKIIFMNDCGPDVETMEKNILKKIASFSHCEYHRNPHNLGFVGTCNRAVYEVDRSDNDILLLNSDTIVTRGFLDKLQSVLSQNQKIAAVSPRSNNATITTIPMTEMKNHGIEPDLAFKVFKKISPLLPALTITPVAHGFCMLIRRPVIKKFGLFDPVFGKGYGEETDFCMRVAKKGYLSAICNRAFVYHMEARSFSLEAKQKLIAENDKITTERYPDYHSLIRRYINEDADIIDRLAYAISGLSKDIVIDVRGITNEQKEASKEFLKVLLKNEQGGIYYFGDESDKVFISSLTNKPLRLGSPEGCYEISVRPFAGMTPRLFTLLSKTSLHILLPSESKSTIDVSIKDYCSFADGSNVKDMVKKIRNTKPDVSLLRRRWVYTVSQKSLPQHVSNVSSSLESAARKVLSKNKLLRRIAKRIQLAVRAVRH